MTLAEGSMLTDNLELQKVLGSGGMGTVWVARNCALGSQVAVKVLHGDASRLTQEVRQRFEQEARGLAQIDHPHVVKVFDYGITGDGEPFLVMELLRGEDLRQRLDRVGRLGLGDTATIVSQACKALSRAHAMGVVHRDIKPANLFLLEAEGEIFVKVLDFGVAKFADAGALEMTRTGATIGTPYYMSPEQFVDPKRIDQRTDVWALGIVTYACLTGKHPFEGETMPAIAMQVCNRPFHPVQSLRPDLPAAVEAWMGRALAREIEQRFPSAREMGEALVAASVGAPGAAPHAPPIGAISSGPGSVQSRGPTAYAAQPGPTGGSTPALTAGEQSWRASAPPGQQASAPPGQHASASPGHPYPSHAASPASGTWSPAHAAAPAPTTARSSMGLVLGALALVVALGVAAAGAYWFVLRSPTPVAAATSAPARGTEPASPTGAVAAIPAAPGQTARPGGPRVTTSPASKPGSGAPATNAGGAAATTVAPTGAPTSAPKAGRSTSGANAAVTGCWRNTEGAAPGTAASSVSVSFNVDQNGRASAIAITGPGRQGRPGFVSCSVTRLSELGHGPGEAQAMSLGVSLPAAPP